MVDLELQANKDTADGNCSCIDMGFSIYFWYIDWSLLLSGTVIRDEIGLSLDKVGREVLGTAAKVVLTKDTTTIVGDGSTQDEVTKRVAQIKTLIEV